MSLTVPEKRALLKALPNTRRALLALDSANGAVNRYCPNGQIYDVSNESHETLDAVERFTGTLNDEDLMNFVDGEESEIAETFLENRDGRIASEFLNRMFEQDTDEAAAITEASA